MVCNPPGAISFSGVVLSAVGFLTLHRCFLLWRMVSKHDVSTFILVVVLQTPDEMGLGGWFLKSFRDSIVWGVSILEWFRFGGMALHLNAFLG